MAESQNYTLGRDARTYFSTTLLDADTNTPGSVTWTEMTNLKDLTLNLQAGEIDITTRATARNGWEAAAPGLKSGEISFEMQWRPGDAGFEALRDAWLTGSEVAIAAMDGDIDAEGKQGLAANFVVLNFTRNEPVGETISVSVSIKPSSFPQWYEVPAAV